MRWNKQTKKFTQKIKEKPMQEIKKLNRKMHANVQLEFTF